MKVETQGKSNFLLSPTTSEKKGGIISMELIIPFELVEHGIVSAYALKRNRFYKVGLCSDEHHHFYRENGLIHT